MFIVDISYTIFLAKSTTFLNFFQVFFGVTAQPKLTFVIHRDGVASATPAIVFIVFFGLTQPLLQLFDQLRDFNVGGAMNRCGNLEDVFHRGNILHQSLRKVNSFFQKAVIFIPMAESSLAA